MNNSRTILLKYKVTRSGLRINSFIPGELKALAPSLRAGGSLCQSRFRERQER